MFDSVKEFSNVHVRYPVHRLTFDPYDQGIERAVRAPTGLIPIRESQEVGFIDGIENRHHRLLDDFVFQAEDIERSLAPIFLGDQDPPRRLRACRRSPTIQSCLKQLARLGGYLDRASDPPPGNIVIWRGMLGFRHCVWLPAWRHNCG